MSVFPLDIRGLQNSGLLRAEQRVTHDEFSLGLEGSQPSDMSPYSNATALRQGEAANSLLAMESVATETGGVVLSGSNDISKLFDRVQQLWAGHYVLTFVPEKVPDNAPSAYHKIKVKIRRQGVKVLARRGYVTRPLRLISGEEEIRTDLREALNSPIDLTSLPLQLDLGKAHDTSDGRRVPFALTVSGGILAPPVERAVPFDLSIAMVVRGRDNEVVSSAAKRIKSSIALNDLQRASSKGLRIDLEFAAPAKKDPYFGRVIVRDNFTGRIGTISLPLPPAGVE